MRQSKKILFVYFLLVCWGCNIKEENKTSEQLLVSQSGDSIQAKPEENKTTIEAETIRKEPKPATIPANLADTAFVEIAKLDSEFAFDMRYATSNNFLDTAIYPCATCKIRYEVAKALVKANEELKQKGYRIKFFDCYRPLDVQKKMWEVYPNARYVANPYTSGSMHNRGGAVDITLVDLQGNELDMGTEFDHFGKEAHHSYQALPQEVLENRKLLKESLEKVGFKAITTEWWHYSYRHKYYSLANEGLCN